MRCPNCNHELEQLKGKHKFDVQLGDKESPQDVCECGHERQWHDFNNMKECRVDIAGNPTINCYCLKFRNAKVHAEEKKN